MDPLLVAAYSSTASGKVAKNRKAEDAFYNRHGGPVFRRAVPAASAAALTAAFVVVAGLLGQ